MNFRKELGWVRLSFQCSSQRSRALPCYRSAVPGQTAVQNVNVLPCAQTPQKNIFFTISVTLSLLFFLRGNSTVSVIAWSEMSYYFNPANPFAWHQFLIKHVTYMSCCSLSKETLKSSFLFEGFEWGIMWVFLNTRCGFKFCLDVKSRIPRFSTGSK